MPVRGACHERAIAADVVVLKVRGSSHEPGPADVPLAARSDDDLMVLAGRDVVAAFEALVRRYARRVIAVCARHTGDPALGDETAQDVWVAVWDHRRDYVPGGRFPMWLFTIVRNRLRNGRRDRGRRELPKVAGDHGEVLARTADGAPSDLDRLLVLERRRRVDRALGALPEAQREAVLLRFTEGLSYEHIAAILQTNESTARSRVFHGIRELRRRLRSPS